MSARLPICLLLAGGWLAGGCAPRQSGGSPGWQLPELPGPVALEVAGAAVPKDALDAWLLAQWADYCDARGISGPQAGAAQQRAFYEDPAVLLEPLIGDVLLLQEAERRWPSLAEEEVAAFLRDMEAGAGGAVAALRDQLGAAGLRAHAERRIRLAKILADLGREVAEPTGEELLAEYQAALARLAGQSAGAAEVRGALPAYQDLEEALRHKLLVERRGAAARAWIAERRAGVTVRFTGLDGVTSVLPPP